MFFALPYFVSGLFCYLDGYENPFFHLVAFSVLCVNFVIDL